MQIFSDKVRPGKASTKIPDRIIELPAGAGDASAIILWMQLLCSSKQGTFLSHEQLANQCGRPVKTWRRLLSRLEKMGLVVLSGKDIILIDPYSEVATYEESITKPPEVKETKKQPLQLTSDSVIDKQLIVDAWNKYKPEKFFEIDLNLSEECITAYESHIKKLKHDINDIDGFTAAICKSLKASAFWNSKTFKFWSVFGFGIPDDKKFRNVEILYREGMQLIKIDNPVLELVTYDSQSILDRFNSWQRDHYDGLPDKKNACLICSPPDYKSNVDDLFSTIRRYIALQAKPCVGMGQLDATEIIGIEKFFHRNNIDPCDYMFYYNEVHGWPTEARPATANREESIDEDLWVFYEDSEQAFKSKPNLISDVW